MDKATLHEPVAVTGVGASVGARLRAAREASGATLSDIAARTRVPQRHLTAIEADAHDSLPALPYTIGFVKAFARSVGLDPNEIGQQFRAETSKGAHMPSQPAELVPVDERRLPPVGLVAGATAAVLLALALAWAWGQGWFGPATPAPPVVAEAQPEVPAATVPAPSGAAPATTAAAPPPGPPPTAVGAATPVTITATDDAWMRIYDRISGRAVFEGILAKDQTYTVPPPQAGWLLRTGRAGALQIRVGERLIPPLGGPVETVKHVPIGPEALVARAAAPLPPPAG